MTTEIKGDCIKTEKNLMTPNMKAASTNADETKKSMPVVNGPEKQEVRIPKSDRILRPRTKAIRILDEVKSGSRIPEPSDMARRRRRKGSRRRSRSRSRSRRRKSRRRR